MSTFDDRQILTTAQGKGFFATALAYLRLSGPGWMQSAITLGGGSLVGALYLGMLGGNELLWLHLVAIVIGVIMLAAISYVTLSTHQRPYEAINDHVNPILGVGWVTATILANMIWILPQFSLCFDAIDKSLMPGILGDSIRDKAIVSAVLAILGFVVVYMSFKPGWASKIFDLFLKLVIMLLLFCFVGVAVWLIQSADLDWTEILVGFIPDFGQWFRPSSTLQELAKPLEESTSAYWQELIVKRQRENMTSVAATAVAINMTFLLPYSMLSRGWDKPFRGLARFDLVVALAIPFLLVTSCIVIASAHAFHGKADQKLLSSVPEEIQESILFDGMVPVLEARMSHLDSDGQLEDIDSQIEILNRQIENGEDESDREAAGDLLIEAEAFRKSVVAKFAAGLEENERRLALALVKPNISQLSATLEPIFGANSSWSRWMLGLGALAMGFSTLVILSLINGLAFAEVWGDFESRFVKTIGAGVALLFGFFWIFIWSSGSKTYLVIAASTFGAILLPIAYISFFALMNSKRCLGDEKPAGARRWIWNILMAICVVGGFAQAYGGISTKLDDPNPIVGPMVIGGCVTFLLLAIIGFSARPEYDYGDESE